MLGTHSQRLWYQRHHSTNSFKARLDKVWNAHAYEESDDWYESPPTNVKCRIFPQNESDVQEEEFSDDGNDRHKGVLA